MNLLKIFLSVVICVSVVIFNSCSAGSIKIKDQQEISEESIKKSDNFIISKTGKDFFEKNITFNNNKTTKFENSYLMVYDFKIPVKEYINEEISFIIDNEGNINKEKDIIGIPDCLTNNCDFSIDESNAKQIAADNNFEKGIKDWKADFVWNEKHQKYVWAIQSTSYEGEGSQGYRGGGNIIFIDASSGEILETTGWRVN